MGSNMAENHPVGFQWVLEAKERGARIFHVDPRFTRTSALATDHVRIRAGTDIAFLGGVVNYILEHERDFREYVLAYTNAAALVSADFRDTEDLDGLFSGWDGEEGAYETSSWRLEGGEDRTLQDPRCVFQLLRRHYARYTPELVAETCGCSAEQLVALAEALCTHSGRERTGAFVYSVGWTQHTVGVQYIRAAAIIQLLLGNVGRPGGGVLALRGHASIQGSTDIPTLFNLLPGYLSMADPGETLDTYLEANGATGGSWGNLRVYLVSLLKAYWGEHATAANDFCFDHLPRITGDHSTYRTTLDMLDGKVEGYFVLGQNPAVGSANSRLHRLALAQLEWLVVRDFGEIETAAFWHDGPELESGELRPEEIGTEIFFLPAAAHTEKDGSFTNTQRLLQWHEQAVEPQGDCRSELWFAYHLGRRIHEKLAGSAEERDRPIRELAWDYPTHGPLEEPSAEAVLREINGWDADGAPLSSAAELRGDGSTTCGCWIYCGCFAEGVNRPALRKPRWEQSRVAPEWGWAWPANRRLLYNRASADPEGAPWSERKRYVWWDGAAGRWTGEDVPDFEAGKRPEYRPAEDAEADEAIAGDRPFVLHEDGLGRLFVPDGVVDGPLPTHYEPHESPFESPLYGQRANPARLRFERPENPSNESPSSAFPYVATTYRLTEHHTAGGMTRSLPYLAELQPEMFCEVSPELAAERGLAHGGWATIVTTRSAIEARVLVTERIRPLQIQGRTLQTVGLPFHWGFRGLTTGGAANDLFPIVLDPNVSIQEVKAATCDIRPGRLPARGDGWK
jgi:formate dehydrogenase major subunit